MNPPATAAPEAPPEVAAEGDEQEGIIKFPGVKSEPGEQGIATQDDGPTVQSYAPREPTPAELGIADEILDALENRAKLAPEEIVSALIRIVDVHHKFSTPDLFGGKGEDREIYEGASVVGEIARLLCRCPKITVGYRRLGFWFKDHEKWTSAGVTVAAQVKRFDGFQQHMNDGMLAVVLVNYHHWKTLNPRQKVYTVYNALRQLDEAGGKVAPDWHGYFEEPALFGAGVHREMVSMARAFTKDAPARAGEPYQLSILDEAYDDKAEAE